MYTKFFTLLLISAHFSQAMDFTISKKDVSFKGQIEHADKFFEQVKKIVEAKQDVNAFIMQDGSQDSFLTYAIKLSREDIVSYLLKNKANVNFVNKEGKSALELAAEKSCTEIARMLLDKGAYAHIDNAFYIAQKKFYSAHPTVFSDTEYWRCSSYAAKTFGILLEGRCKAHAKYHLDTELNKDVSNVVMSYLE